jgi:uncharacterized protein (DUF302 family)
MKSISIKKVLSGETEQIVQKVTEALKQQGFGVLTRIDLDVKIKEKLGKDLKPIIILGACNPKLAFDAYVENPDVTALLPCNAVLRELDQGKVSVELARPSVLMEIVGERKLVEMSEEADKLLQKALESLH